MIPINKQILFILVCLNESLDIKHLQLGANKYKYWVIDNELTRINDGTYSATELITKWSKLCQFQS